jgi:hypothetical protein
MKPSQALFFVVRTAAYVGLRRLLSLEHKLRQDGGSMLRSPDASLIGHTAAA